MQTEAELSALNEEMRLAVVAGDLERAAELGRQLLASPLLEASYYMLWFHHCEGVGDAMHESDPEFAAQMFGLAVFSNRKAAEGATSAGEGRWLSAKADDVERKWDRACAAADRARVARGEAALAFSGGAQRFQW